MKFRLLGPLEVRVGEEWKGIGAPKWRSVLAALLINAGQIVSADALINEVWGDVPPAKAANLISIYVLRLRRLLGDADSSLLVTRAPGYQLRVAAADTDALLFEAMGFEGNFALLVLPALIQLASLAAVLVSLVLVDRIGRRPILLSGIAAMILGDAVLVGVFAAKSSAVSGLGYVGLLMFTMGFTFGFGALVWVYAGESFPAHLRSLGSSMMLTANLTANALVAAVFLTMLNTLGGAGMFTVFALLACAGLVMVYRFAPETKGRQLEDIRHFWENNGRWPDETTSAATDVPACR